MIAHFLEASVMFQTENVLEAYGIVFGTLAVFCIVTFVRAMKTKIE